MKIITAGLHSIYDQYSNDENRLTHALLHTIGSSRWLLSKFLKEVVSIDKKIPISSMTYEITTQKKPFSYGDNKPEEVGSVPDAWIIDQNSKLGLVIEVKDKKKALKISQLQNHVKQVRDFKKRYLLIITPDLSKPKKVKIFQDNYVNTLKVEWRSWDNIYRWLAGLTSKNLHLKEKEKFLVKSMIDFLERRKEVLGFQGIKFQNNSFNVSEAKTILNAEMEELQPFVKKVYKSLGRRRPAISTFSKESVWDCFGNDKGFTADLHLTFDIHESLHNISITVPNSAKKPWHRLKTIFSGDYEKQLYAILKNLRDKVPHLFIEFNQRHFIAQRIGIKDGYMEFNIDTVGSPFRRNNSPVKEYPMWITAIKNAVLDKKGINGQVMFKARFYLKETKGIDKPQFIYTAKDTIKAFKPLYDFLKEK